MAKKQPAPRTKTAKTTNAAATPKVRARSRTKRAASGVKQASTASRPDGLVVYIHGIGYHKPKDELKVEWDLALFGSDRGEDTRMAYWSDLVHGPRTSVLGLSKSATADDAGSGDEDVVAAALSQAGLAQNTAADAWARNLMAELGASQGPRSGPGKKVLPLPAWLRRPISRAFLKALIADTAAYFFNPGLRDAIRERLKTELQGAKGPITVVAHSQGSIVAVEVLADLGNTVDVERLVTIGSPLGLQEVQDFLQLTPQKKPFTVPAGVRSWRNFADILDPVAADKELHGEFVFRSKTDPSAAVPVIVDEIILNERVRRMRGFNPHSAVGYLSHPSVRKSVGEAVQHDIMARFVVARDVAEVLAVQQRHPVLIEVLEPGYEALGEEPDERRARELVLEKESGPQTLDARIAHLRTAVETVIRRRAGAGQADVELKQARVDTLRRFVAARLLPDEIRELATEHRNFNVYAVWRSASKKKLIRRSRAVLQADAALESYGAAGAGITWAVLDTGVAANHPHFEAHGTIKEVWDCTETGPPRLITKADDLDGHGSHVCGIIAGEQASTPESGQPPHRGVAPRAKLVVYKVLNNQGEGEDAWIIKALDHIATKNENTASLAVHGLNLSLGGPYDSTVYGCGFTPICQELRRLWRSGVLVVVASGNEGQLDVQTRDGEIEINSPMSIGDPANLEDCIAVGSVNADRPHLYGVSPFSSRGPTSDGRVKPDVVAPGERISSVNAHWQKGKNRPAYRTDSGTSMAAPHISGMLAAFLSVRREFRGRPDEVKKLLLDTCTDLGRDRYHQGRGLPNLMKMLLSV